MAEPKGRWITTKYGARVFIADDGRGNTIVAKAPTKSDDRHRMASTLPKGSYYTVQESRAEGRWITIQTYHDPSSNVKARAEADAKIEELKADRARHGAKGSRFRVKSESASLHARSDLRGSRQAGRTHPS